MASICRFGDFMSFNEIIATLNRQGHKFSSVFLDYAQVPPSNGMIGIHRHSGIATLTVVVNAALA